MEQSMLNMSLYIMGCIAGIALIILIGRWVKDETPDDDIMDE